ncbi:tyrosine-type recombinase/integrase [Phytohabitans houttuyneae]|uniref:tyrosine-type recombinase/integrase n=1 Tax=Phytohabitans houttuyneae TaxID=1076126 RepID=UPI001C49C118|nr:site-specific integrase [Phytohabitans houttuyneae]
MQERRARWDERVARHGVGPDRWQTPWGPVTPYTTSEFHPDPARRMMFYLGTGQPQYLGRSPIPLFLAATALARYRRRGDAFPAQMGAAPWAGDSGAYSALMLRTSPHGHPWYAHPDEYGAMWTRFLRDVGPPDFVGIQDRPCEPGCLNRTRSTVREHQEATLRNYLYLVDNFPFVPWLPTLQGWHPWQYEEHADMYQAAGVDLAGQRVGVGSICRRGSQRDVATVLGTMAPLGMRMHGFGVSLSTPFLLVRCPVCSLVTSLLSGRWRVCLAQRDLPIPEDARPWVAEFGIDLDGWLDERGIADGVPFLLSPSFEYDVELNAFFRSWQITSMRRASQVAYARDLARFLTFLSVARGGRGWRDATEDDHLAFHAWRRRDPAGPAVAGSTWDREVASVNRFFAWAVERALVVETPVPQRVRRLAPSESGRRGGGTTPATYSHDAAAERVQWLPPAEYRRWRDVGLRGYGPNGLPDSRFRGRWAGRNAAFADLMVRTGLRLTEQASLLRPEVPIGPGQGGYRRFWLPAAIAKGGSARWVYVPDSMARELGIYVAVDRAEAVDTGRRAGLYDRIRRPLVIEDAARPVAVAFDGRGSRRVVKLAALDPAERRRVLVAGEHGLEPAALWISEYGTPVAPSTWKSVFADANARCQAVNVALRVHPHMLRHTFAVVTLEQLQRGHLVALAGQTAEQRGHYTRIFGDPLDWVRRRLGHRSLTSTMIYLHALAELEMHTRMALVPDGWEDPHPQVLAAAGAS